MIAAVAVSAAVLAGVDNGHAARDVRLLSGAAWLSSSKVGQATLLDGTSVEVLAQVPVASAGNALDVVQQGSTAYAVDQSAGTVRRIDGATFEVSQPESPIPDAKAGLTAIPGQDALYVLDNRRGVLANADPRTLVRRGELLSLASQLSAGTAIVDDAGTLWAIDSGSGNVTRVAGGARSVRPNVAQPGRPIMALANGHPVVVDPGARKVLTLDGGTGRVAGTAELDLRGEDSIQVSGSPHAQRVYVVTSRGTLTICDLGAGTCDDVVPLASGNQFGAAVEAGNKLFVPDHTTGQVWIIDLAGHRVVGKPTVLTPPGAFQLLSRDGVVFFNEPFSDRAGVVRLDGTVAQAKKYDASDPTKGITTPHDPGRQPKPEPNQPKPNEPQPPGPTSPRQPDPGKPQPPQNPNDPPPPPDNPPPNNPPPNEPQPPDLQIVMGDTSPMVDQPITIKVRNNNTPAVKSAKWTFGDSATGEGIETSHKWAAAQTYQLSVQAILEDGREVAKSDTITVTAKPTHKLTVTIFDGGGTITGGGIDCPGKCSVDIEEDTAVTLIANPQAPNSAGPWTGDCTGSGTRCDLVMKTDKNVTYTFTKPPPVTFSVTEPNGGTINGSGFDCPGTCSRSVPPGTPIQVVARAGRGWEFGSWAGACAGQSPTCNLTVSQDQSASVAFRPQLTVTVPERPSGWVTYPGGQCNEGANCVANYALGQTITLQAFDGPGSGGTRKPVFSHWTGACDGNSRTCTLTMDGPKDVGVVYIIMG